MAARPPASNRLLQLLSPADRALLDPNLAPVDLEVRASFERPNRRIEDVVFPETGIASVVAEHPNGQRIEIGLVGCEGMSGSAVVLGDDRSPHATYIQLAGAGKRIPVAALRKRWSSVAPCMACS